MRRTLFPPAALRLAAAALLSFVPFAAGCDRLTTAGLPANAPTARRAGSPGPAVASGAAALQESPTSRPAPTADPYLTAWQRGVGFRASGVEPGWYVEVFGGGRPTRLELVWDYASNRLASRTVRRSDNGAVLSFEAEDERFAVSVRATRTPCAEPGSGLPAEYTVTVDVGAQTLHGCGRGR